MNARAMYEELVVDLLQRRQQSGGKLDPDTEAAIAGELQIYWRKMSDDERNRIEVQLALIDAKRAPLGQGVMRQLVAGRQKKSA